MKKQIALILALILSLSAWAWVLAEEGEEPFCWSDPGKYLINSLEPVKEIHNEEEAEAYAKELWSVFSSEPYPEGTGDMNVDKADGSYHFGIYDDTDANVYSANFLGNGLVQAIGFYDKDERWLTKGRFTELNELDAERWAKSLDQIAAAVDKLNPGIMKLVGPMEKQRIIDVGDKIYLMLYAAPLDPEYVVGMHITAILYPDGTCVLKEFSCYGAG